VDQKSVEYMTSKIDGIATVFINGVGYKCTGAQILIGPVPRKKTRKRLRRERVRRNRDRRLIRWMKRGVMKEFRVWQDAGFITSPLRVRVITIEDVRPSVERVMREKHGLEPEDYRIQIAGDDHRRVDVVVDGVTAPCVSEVNFKL
jgi:hypothetical protein